MVTQDTSDFTPLVERETMHPGLIRMTVAHGLMSLDVQQALFAHALDRINYALNAPFGAKCLT